MIHGTRISFRAFTREDIPTLVRWHNDGEVMPYWGHRQPVFAPATDDADFGPAGRFTRFDERGELCLCDETGRAIGRFGFHDATMRDRHVEISLSIGEHYFRDGAMRDELIYGMLAREFNARYRPEETGWVVSGEIPPPPAPTDEGSSS